MRPDPRARTLYRSYGMTGLNSHGVIEWVKSLPKCEQEIFWLRARGLSWERIAEVSGKSRRTIGRIVKTWDGLRESVL